MTEVNKDTPTPPESGYRMDNADKWAMVPFMLVSVPLLAPFFAHGYYIDHEDQRFSSLLLMAEDTGLAPNLILTGFAVCLIVGLIGAFLLTRAWINRKDELERQVEYESYFWMANGLFAMIVCLPFFEFLAPHLLTSINLATIASVIYLTVYFSQRSRIRRQMS